MRALGSSLGAGTGSLEQGLSCGVWLALRTARIHSLQRGEQPAPGVCASVFAGHGSSCRCLLERFLYMARIANGGIKTPLPSLVTGILQEQLSRAWIPNPNKARGKLDPV